MRFTQKFEKEIYESYAIEKGDIVAEEYKALNHGMHVSKGRRLQSNKSYNMLHKKFQKTTIQKQLNLEHRINFNK
jgi:hypothetical protein